MLSRPVAYIHPGTALRLLPGRVLSYLVITRKRSDRSNLIEEIASVAVYEFLAMTN